MFDLICKAFFISFFALFSVGLTNEFIEKFKNRHKFKTAKQDLERCKKCEHCIFCDSDEQSLMCELTDRSAYLSPPKECFKYIEKEGNENHA